VSPDLACVVMSFRGREDVVRAVTSLVRQDVRAEILVVNSGGGSPAERLRDAGLAVPVLDVPEPLTPGAARNAGIAATRAPFVAFLAADCWAAPGWIAFGGGSLLWLLVTWWHAPSVSPAALLTR